MNCFRKNIRNFFHSFLKIKKQTNCLIFIVKGDLTDLENVLNKTADSNAPSVSVGHSCSALIQLRKGNTDLFSAHVTFGSYNSMDRLLKLYKFAFGKDSKFKVKILGQPKYLIFPTFLENNFLFFFLLSFETEIGE